MGDFFAEKREKLPTFLELSMFEALQLKSIKFMGIVPARPLNPFRRFLDRIKVDQPGGKQGGQDLYNPEDWFHQYTIGCPRKPLKAFIINPRLWRTQWRRR